SAASGDQHDEAHSPEDGGYDEEDTVSLGPGGDGDAAAGGRGAVPLPSDGGEDGDSACMRFMSWGKTAQAGAVPGGSGMDAIVTWLNEASTAAGVHYQEKPAITSELLDYFDVL